MAIVGRTNAHNVSVAKPGKLSDEVIWRGNTPTLALGDSWQFTYKMGAKTGGKREIADIRLEYNIMNNGAGAEIIGFPGSIWALATTCCLYINGQLVFELPSKSFSLHHRLLQNLANDSMSRSDLHARCYEELGLTDIDDATTLLFQHITLASGAVPFSNSLMNMWPGIFRGATDAHIEEIRLEFTLCNTTEAIKRLRWDTSDLQASFALTDLRVKLEFVDHPESIMSPGTPILLHSPRYYYKNYGNALATTPYRFNLNTDFPRCRMKRVYIALCQTTGTQVTQHYPIAPIGNQQLTSLTLYRNGVVRKTLDTPSRIFHNSNRSVKAQTGRDLIYHSGTLADAFQHVMIDFTGLDKSVYALGDSHRHFSVGGVPNCADVYEIELERVSSGYLASDLVVVVEADRLHRMNGTHLSPVEDKATPL